MAVNHRTGPKLVYLISMVTAFSAATPLVAGADVSQTPLAVAHAVRPRVLFVMSNDHALYYKAYTDWNDLDLDGIVDTTFRPGLRYYGYFDPEKCYRYDNGRFEPGGLTPNGYCDQVEGDWSGSFMNWASMARIDIVRKVLYGGYRSTDTAGETVLERSFLPTDAHSFAKYYEGPDIARLTPFAVDAITLCNTTYEGNAVQSQNVTRPPLIRVAQGDFRYWAANERWQCTWDDEHGDNSSGTNTTGSSTSDPNRVSNGLGEKDYIARVQVCVDGRVGSESCERYPDGDLKPTGLLHDYGEYDQIRFGLMTGSYQRNKSGGVLRKNVASFGDEVNTRTDGTFTGVDGIVATLDRFRITRYSYSDGLYNNTDNCLWGRSSFNEGSCSNWGNPLGEIYLEALRYYAGLSPTAAFDGDDTGYIANLADAVWQDPLDDDEWCANCDIILINASGSSYDNDAMSAGGLTGAPNAFSLTDALGDAEGISGNRFFVGENGTDNNQLCTAKTVDALGDVRGACPGEPRLSGTYLLAGLAHWANTHDIRPMMNTQEVTTRAVALLPASPRLEVPIPGRSGTISILPACRNREPDPDGNCGLVDFKLISQDLQAGTGTAYVNWEDTEQGGDYDQDMKGTLSYAINAAAGTVTITTDVDAQSTPHTMGFGYVVSGTTADGFHVHSGINAFDYTDPGGGLGCVDCQQGDWASSRTYTLGESSAGLLEEPLWYAAKYGSFIDTNANDLPDQQAEWDADGDGFPDGFFLANNPGELGPSLARFLTVIATTTSSASVAANSITLSTQTRIYQARYDSSNWTGDLLAFPINPDGSIADPQWSAQDAVDTQSQIGARRIVTTNADSRTGVPFRWGDANSGNADGIADMQKLMLRKACPSCNLEAEQVGQQRLDYLRGSDAEDVDHGGLFRSRDHLLGDISNSSPRYVGAPESLYPENIAPASYRAFVNAQAERGHALYTGANDGMLHAFAADTGEELMAYVPRAVYPRLSALAAPAYIGSHQFYVDGSPTAIDAYLGAFLGWRTMLVTALGAGGPGVFALDVTDPTAFSADEATAAGRVLWDITGDDPGFESLGYAFSNPAIVRLPDGNLGDVWAVAFGNGYHDDDADPLGQAVLYLVDARDGHLLDTVLADPGPGNGLSSVAPVDYNGDFRIDYIYAGDIKGNLWRFEPDGGVGWKVSFGGQPLFTTGPKGAAHPGDHQAITTRPEVIYHPSSRGMLILFGTGTYYRDLDRLPDPTTTNAFYGVWDRLDGTSEIGIGHLLQQSLMLETTTLGYDIRFVTDNEIQWHTDAGKPTGDPPTTHLGWYLELVDEYGLGQGEVQVTESQVRGGRVIFTTLIPSELACDFGGEGWLMELEAASGGPVDEVLYDLNGDGAFSNLDMVPIEDGAQVLELAPSGKKSKVGIIQPPAIVAAGAREYKYASGAREAAIEVTTENPGETAGGRRSWIQLR